MANDTPRPFSDLSPTGLLWYINKAALHPRGFALAVHYDDEGNAIGWELQGDGCEAWRFSEEIDDSGFTKFETFVAEAKIGEYGG